MVAAAVAKHLGEHDTDIDRLAELTGMSATALADRLGERSDFTVTELASIAAALDVSPSTLVPMLPPPD